ncbi:MAG: septum formation initiator family protein [Clostridiaceae bacterium]|nr:septum formation initiator family protein [Clostridiaceae bacterium]
MSPTSKTQTISGGFRSGGYPLARVIVVVFFLILFAVVGSMLIRQNDMYQRVADRSVELERSEREAIAENESAKDLKKKVGSDDHIEQIARDQLGLVKPGETIYQTGD